MKIETKTVLQAGMLLLRLLFVTYGLLLFVFVLSTCIVVFIPLAILCVIWNCASALVQKSKLTFKPESKNVD